MSQGKVVKVSELFWLFEPQDRSSIISDPETKEDIEFGRKKQRISSAYASCSLNQIVVAIICESVGPFSSLVFNRMPELIKVAARVRPALSENDSIAVTAEERNRRICVEHGKSHIYDAVYGADSDQVTIFEDMVKPIIEGCVEGYNGTVFVYGQTGSGKTYTMLGAETEESDLDVKRRGLIPRSLEHLFQMLHSERAKRGASFKFVCQCSFVELYNEELYDLLDDKKSDGRLRVRQAETVIVDGAKEETVHSCNDAVDVLMQGWKNRKVAETAMNRESSRSHAIFIVSLETDYERNGAINRKRSRINLVDLAGSERQEHTKTSGTRLKEAASINKSLLVLTRVIERLSANTVKMEHAHVPYRDSKLTHLLSDSLGGNARTAVIVNVHPGLRFRTQSVATLQFADNVKCIENVATVNEDVTTRDIEAWRSEILRLKSELREKEKLTVTKEAHEKQIERNAKLVAQVHSLTGMLEKAQQDKAHLEETLVVRDMSIAVMSQAQRSADVPALFAQLEKNIAEMLAARRNDSTPLNADAAAVRQLRDELRTVQRQKELLEAQLEGLRRKERRTTRYTPQDNNHNARRSFLPVFETGNGDSEAQQFLDIEAEEAPTAAMEVDRAAEKEEAAESDTKENFETPINKTARLRASARIKAKTKK
ncbi:hypothetical protein L596_019644 [Steinernema carpocapsae]|uniref:Kinesin-like protein n=1 Tax=Steinernema carpocapsae TaxID=34508 RepID=A0A4U5MR77_STECR|nr:hypothetical protein L596_019644 [Steinernema carpocapsae]